MSRIPVDQLKASVSIVSLIGRDIQLRRDGRRWKACCPFHGEKTPSFVIFHDHFHCFGCGAHGDVLDWVQRTRRMSLREAVAFLGGEISDRPPQPQPKPQGLQRNATTDLVRAIWRASVPARGSPAERYLASRGLYLPDDAPLRFHPRCPRGEDKLPAMITLMTDPVTGAPCGLHRTFIRPDGSSKAPLDPAKMMLGNTGVIRLVPDDDVSVALGISEGIETALAVMQLIEWGPCWAAGSASGIANFPVIPGITTLTIFADHDDGGAGLRSARQCATRWAKAGHTVHLQIPPPGRDWLSAFEERAA